MPIELLSGTECYRSFSEWQEVEENQQDRLKEQWLLGQSISKSTRNYSDQVRCSLCLQTFQLSQTKTPSDSDLRENLHCPGCQINSRGRAALTLLLAERTNEHSIYLTEQLSSAFRFVRDKFANCMGSEYCEDENRLGKMRLQLRSICPGTELRIEDVTALQMDDDSVDAIGSFDVLEHVPDYRAGLREFHRVLKPGGTLVLTVPFALRSERSIVRASYDPGGQLVHHLPEEFHGDPIRGETLCYYHFAWDLLDELRVAGFRDAQWIRVWSPGQAVFGEWCLQATS